MTKMNWNRPAKVYPRFAPDASKLRGCAHVWLDHSDKWRRCVKCKRFKPRNMGPALPTSSTPTDATG